MKILAVERPVSGVDDALFTEDLLRAEAEKAWKLHQSGILRELYFSADKHDAVLVLECSGADEARHCLAQLPLVHAGLIDFEVIPLAAYDGFARLFANNRR